MMRDPDSDAPEIMSSTASISCATDPQGLKPVHGRRADTEVAPASGGKRRQTIHRHRYTRNPTSRRALRCCSPYTPALVAAAAAPATVSWFCTFHLLQWTAHVYAPFIISLLYEALIAAVQLTMLSLAL